MNFFKTAFWGSLSTGVTMLCGLITTKYVAVMIGPEGMAYMGQFSNSTVLVSLLASAACISGVVKYVAEYHGNPEKQREIVRSALSLILFCTICCSLFIAATSFYFSKTIFNSTDYAVVFLIYAALLIFPTFNGLVGAILNGLQQIKKIAIFNVISSVINVAFILISVKYWGIKGVLVAGFFSAAAFSYVYYRSLKAIDLLPKFSDLLKPDKKIIVLLLGFSAMNIVSGVLAPAMQLAVRSHLLYDIDTHTAGLWQANMRLSDYYLNFVFTVMSMYYLPKLSSIHSKKELKKEVWLGYARIIPIVIVITIGIWLCRNIIVQVLLTKQFDGMLVLLKWQLIGDVVRIATAILTWFLVARALKKTYIILEIIFALTYVFANYVMVDKFGLVGTAYAFVINYAVYLLVLIVIVGLYFRKDEQE